MTWICCQLGAREHYAVARALHQAGALGGLMTDAWAPPGSLWERSGGARLRERFHPDLADAPVRAWNAGLIAFELAARAKRLSGWPLILARNDWFQQQALRALEKKKTEGARQPSTICHLPSASEKPILFSYSYTARRPFELAKRRGWKTVLGQIDGGVVEARRMQRLQSAHPNAGSTWNPPPPAYWEAWKEELRLADRVIVNSRWSQQCLMESGFIEPARITVIPLAYRPPAECAGFVRRHPGEFNAARPLRVLFLGQVNVRKGVLAIFDAIRALADLPMTFTFVGPISLAVPPELRASPRVTFTGPVPRSEVIRHYQAADVFLFPTHSDGFGLTQLEAQAWKLPLVVSPFCGEVAREGHNGIVLPEVSAGAISDALRACCRDAGQLAEYSRNSVAMEDYGIPRLAERLQKLL